jgi:hypothetical protein
MYTKKECALAGCYRRVPPFRKNGLYCCAEHQYEAKKLRIKEQYQQNKIKDEISKAEDVLEHYLKMYNTNTVSAQYLEDVNFPWHLCETKNVNGWYMHCLKHYGIIIWDDQSIKIYKL